MPSIAIPVSLRGQLLYSTRIFDPLSLFAANEPGIWLDPSDLTTMFQDRAGSTAVTTPGQSVGLRLDKSKGLVLGSELVTNGTFDSGTTGWTAFNSESSISESGGELFTSHIGGVASPAIGAAQVLSLVVGKAYKVTAMVRRQAGADSVNLAVTNNARSAFVQQGPAITNTNATMAEIVFVATETNNVLYLRAARAVSAVGWSGGVFDNISVKELPGNHAVSNSDAARGIYGIEPLGGRRNLLTFTEQFDNAVWAKGGGATIASTATVGPLGAGLAQKLQEAATTNAFSISVAPGMALNTTHVLTVYMKAAERSFGILNIFTGAASCWTWYNLASGTVGTVGSGATASMSSVGDGWYRCSISIATAASGTPNVGIWPANANGSISYAGTAGSGILLWGAQLETGSTATAYQRVTTQYDVTEAGKQTLHYVQYDGSDDGYVTPTITPGIDKVQVFAGVRKLGDPVGIIVELSPTVDTNNGSVILYSTSPSKWGFASRGTTLSVVEPGGYSPPLTSVLTGLGDVSGDRATIRVNGTQISQSTSDQGTGNYLPYLLYIGRRGGTTFSFNGRDYGIITRFGANLDASTIAATESWLNQKTGAF